MKSNNDHAKKTFLRTCAFIIMGLAFAVTFVVLGYSLGMDIPGLPGARPIDTYFFPAASYFHVLFPPIGFTVFILITLRPVLKRELCWGIRPEFVLIGNSLVVIGFMLYIFGDSIPHERDITDLAYSISLVPTMLALGALGVGYLDKYLRGKSVKQQDR